MSSKVYGSFKKYAPFALGLVAAIFAVKKIPDIYRDKQMKNFIKRRNKFDRV